MTWFRLCLLALLCVGAHAFGCCNITSGKCECAPNDQPHEACFTWTGSGSIKFDLFGTGTQLQVEEQGMMLLILVTWLQAYVYFVFLLYMLLGFVFKRQPQFLLFGWLYELALFCLLLFAIIGTAVLSSGIHHSGEIMGLTLGVGCFGLLIALYILGWSCGRLWYFVKNFMRLGYVAIYGPNFLKAVSMFNGKSVVKYIHLPRPPTQEFIVHEIDNNWYYYGPDGMLLVARGGGVPQLLYFGSKMHPCIGERISSENRKSHKGRLYVYSSRTQLPLHSANRTSYIE